MLFLAAAKALVLSLVGELLLLEQVYVAEALVGAGAQAVRDVVDVLEHVSRVRLSRVPTSVSRAFLFPFARVQVVVGTERAVVPAVGHDLALPVPWMPVPVLPCVGVGVEGLVVVQLGSS